MLINKANIANHCDILREAQKVIVFTNGCFDILHAGHVRYLTTAKSYGDVLIVGLNSDASVRRLKGKSRPVNPQSDRAEVLAALRAVDDVVIFDEQTAESLVELIRPDIYVKGGDYDMSNLPEAKIVESYGGHVEFVRLVEGRSTTNIINRLKRSE